MKHAHAKAPGKLYIAGEYAVTEPGYPAVIVAVDRFITVSLSPSSNVYGTICSPQLSSKTLRWKRLGHDLFLEEPIEKAAILLNTMEITERFLREKGMMLPYYDVTIKSSLDNKDGRKYGLGSSGAVTVATILALLESVEYSLDDEGIFKLAAITHTYLESHGSLGDLAAATYTGWIAYSCVDKSWLKEKLADTNLTSLLECSWPELKIERLPSPKTLKLIVGWTGIPASTETYVKSIEQDREELNYQDFLLQSKKCVSDLIVGLKINDTQQVFDSIRYNRELLLEMSRAKEIVIETPLLQRLTRIALKYGAASKTSGAGGGDCGIALIDSSVKQRQILTEWQANKIEPLSLNVYDKSNQ
ncbi:phosphomevalonate kinase [Alkalibacterium sp. f15]|uniref:phosphomevalonate kinase n=1 Tax=Alkalibacterium sp. f15 TaxID=3414029 RepID=UPI003BF80B2E